MNKIVFGTGGLKGVEGEDIIREAFEVGFTVFDTASAYENEETVGNALNSMRENVKLITKIRGLDQGYSSTVKAVEKSLKLLKTDYIDYFLIHWPIPSKNKYLQTFEALLEMKEKGCIQTVGVSNFNIRQLQDIYSNFGLYPRINQIECHPYFQQKEMRAFHSVNNIETFAWSPLNKLQRGILDDTVIREIAEAYNLSPAQIILSYEHSMKVTPVVKSKNKLHMIENLASLKIELDSKDIEKLRALDKGLRRGGDPETHYEE